MVLMALDHVRDFFGPPGINPTNIAATTPALFLTRWVTHICAPTFFLLTGVGAQLASRTMTRRELSRFLLTRGIWLIVLEVVWVRCAGLQFNIDYRVTGLTVLWALGAAMAALSALVWLPMPVIAGFGMVMIAAHNAFDGVRASDLGVIGPLWTVLHVQGVAYAAHGRTLFIAYPLIPWIGVTACGYALGCIYAWPPARRRRLLGALGIGVTAGFVVLRLANGYGDPQPWHSQSSFALSVLSFLNTTKYPPSLLFLLMTLGPALALLAWLDDGTPPGGRAIAVYGRVPLFYYLLHLPLIHLLAAAYCVGAYGSAHWLFESPTLAQYPFTAPPGWGVALPVSYAVWVAVVIAMFPVCRWFAGVKRRGGSAWLRYV